MQTASMDIKGKVALITGSSKRIGRETAVELGRRGARLAIHFRSDKQGALETLRLVEQAGSSGECFQAELTENAAVSRMFGSVKEKFGGLDILVNNASAFHPSVAADVTGAEWDEEMNSNARAPFFVAQAG